MRIKSVVVCSLIAAAAPVASAQAAPNLVSNGSFESGAFVETCCNYMKLANGSTAMTSWTVATATGPIAWGVGATDVIPAPDGIAYVDLSGFGSESLDGAVLQTLSTLTGQKYSFSMDVFGSVAQVMIGSTIVSLGASGTEGGWTIMTGSFIAPAGSQLLSISNVTPGSQIVFIDDVSVTAAVPEPESYAMLLAGLGLLGFAAGRRRRGLVPH